ncbi:MAG: SGNH/GDSL hydrolase family protein [Candidatus Omnitrophica bacterium]|nr:SGNH/GDSL hydrolase family protein [Candidatus Omnitrophota bacterium]
MKQFLPLKNLTLLVATFLIFFLICELALRLSGFYPVNSECQPVIYSSHLGWVLKPDYQCQWDSLEWSVAYQTNALGFRDDHHELGKQTGKKRIVVLGDSMAEGWGVEQDQMWQSLLQDKLGAQYEIINCAVRGYDLIQEYRQFQEVGILYEPDLVIQFLCENDFPDGRLNITPEWIGYKPRFSLIDDRLVFSQEGPEPVLLVKHDTPAVAVKRLLKKSVFLLWLKKRYTLLQPKLTSLFTFGRKSMPSAVPHIDDYEREYVQATEVIYKDFSRLARDHHFTMIVVWQAYVPVPVGLKQILENSDIAVLEINLAPEARFRFDPHANKTGHQQIADIVHAFLQDQRVIQAMP